MTETPRPDDDPRTATAPVDELVTTRHTLTTDAGVLAYTAHTGRVVVGEERIEDEVYRGWEPRSELAITAYTLNDADPTTRPLTFVFNGGPGSSSVWLHLGLLGPRLVDLGEVDALTPPPYGLVDNPHTLLADSDLVFLDPVTTGHSRPAEGTKATEFHGWKKDAEQVAEFIRLWCTREDRWLSPKFLLGESYGTTRAVSVAHRLFEKHGMQLNGLVLISSVLDFGPQDFRFVHHDASCLAYLSTYAAVAHFHGLVPGRTLAEVVAEAEELAAGDYRQALARGNRLTDAERASMAARLSALTGLSEDYLLRCDLRPEHLRFCTELLRSRGLAVGRIDGRFTGPLASRTAEILDADPSMDAIFGPFTAAMHHYLRAELDWHLDLPYAPITDEIENWSYREFEGRPVDVTDKLERLLRANPDLRVRFEYGHYDLATPPGAATETVAHLRLPPGAADRIEHAWFESGHMPYVGSATREAEARGIAEFVRSAR